MLKVNLIGAVNVAHAFAPAMAEAARVETRADESASSRSILFLSSVAGQIGSQTDPPYSAAKAAVINFAQCAAKDLAPFGVRVNTLCPGMVQTPLNRGVYEAWASEQPESERSTYEAWTAEKIKKLVPLNRWQQPEDIAAMAVFLASNRHETSPARRSTSMAARSCTGDGHRHEVSTESRRRERSNAIGDLALGVDRVQLITVRFELIQEIHRLDAGSGARDVADLEQNQVDPFLVQQFPGTSNHADFKAFDVDLEKVDVVKSVFL